MGGRRRLKEAKQKAPEELKKYSECLNYYTYAPRYHGLLLLKPNMEQVSNLLIFGAGTNTQSVEGSRRSLKKPFHLALHPSWVLVLLQ